MTRPAVLARRPELLRPPPRSGDRRSPRSRYRYRRRPTGRFPLPARRRLRASGPSGTVSPVTRPSTPRAWLETDLAKRLREREPEAFEQLVRRHGPRLLAVARRVLRDEDEARDALQDAFLSAFRSIDSFSGNAQLGTWLHRIAVNASLMRLRRRKAQREVPIEELLPGFLEDGHRASVGPAWPEGADRLLERKEARARVHEAIGRLPEGYRLVLVLRDLEGLSGRETGELLDLEPGNVKVRLHRARQALRELLDDLFQRGELGLAPPPAGESESAPPAEVSP